MTKYRTLLSTDLIQQQVLLLTWICWQWHGNLFYHDDVIKWKHFPRYWPFVWGIHRSPVNSTQRPVTRSFDVFFDLRLNKRLSNQSWGWWFETLSRPLWRHCDVKYSIWDVITHPCPDFNGGADKLPLKLRHGWLINYKFLYGFNSISMPWGKCWFS